MIPMVNEPKLTNIIIVILQLILVVRQRLQAQERI